MNLKSFNRLAAAAHGLSLVATLYGFSKRRLDLKQITMKRTTVDGSGATPDQCTIDYDVKLVDQGVFRYDYAIALFFFISFVAHLWYASSDNYALAISEGWNPYRWYEYAASAGVMTTILATADGIRDYPFALALGAVTAGLQFTGYTTESTLKYNSALNPQTLFGAQLTGWFLFVVIWATILNTFFRTVRDVNGLPSNVKVPSWLYFVILSQVVYYGLFGLVQRWHISDRLAGNSRFELHEKRYIQLSFLSKISLAAGFAYGLLFRTRDC
jgi:hypothetical protein